MSVGWWGPSLHACGNHLVPGVSRCHYMLPGYPHESFKRKSWRYTACVCSHCTSSTGWWQSRGIAKSKASQVSDLL